MNPLFKLLPLLLLFFCHTAFSQQRYVISGKVINNLEQPVYKAGILMDNQSVSTDSKGNFILKTALLPSVMTIKHPRYAVQEQLINFPPIGQDTVFITVQLDNKHTDLEEVVITSSRVIWAYPKAHVHVIDFDLQDDRMLLLCKDDNNYLLRYVNELNEPIFDLPIRRHPKRFFRDCMNGIHIMYADSAYEVNFFEDSLTLFPAKTCKQIEQELEPCVLSYNNKLLYGYRGNNLSMDYVMIDTLSKKVMRLYQAKGRKYMRAVAEFERETALLVRDVEEQNARGDNSVEHQLALQHIQEEYLKERALLSQKIYAPAFRFRDSIVVFDHENDSAVVFNKIGRKIRSYPIIYQHHPKWDSELIANEEGTRLFARYNYGGMARLVEINPNDGTVIREVPLVKHIYPGKIQVQGNFIYYVYHHYIDYSINYVYKQRIE